MPFLWNGEPWPDVVAHPLPALALGNRSENIESAFEVIGEPVGDFDRFVLGVIRRIDAIDNRFRAINCEVTV